MTSEGCYIAGAFVDELIDFSCKTSVLAPVPEAEILVDNNCNASATAYNLFDDVKLYGHGVVQVFRGYIVDIIPEESDDVGEILRIRARGYIEQLSSRAIVEAFTTKSRSEIVTSLVASYAPALSTAGVTATTESLSRVFKGKTALQSIWELADELEWDTWVDYNNVFYFGYRAATSTGVTITDSDLTGNMIEFPRKGYDIVNEYLVYGDPNGAPQPCVMVEDRESKLFYGVTRSGIVADKSLKTTQECEDTGMGQLAKTAWSLDGGRIEIEGGEAIEVGKTVRLNLVSRNILNTDMVVLENTYRYQEECSTLRLAFYNDTVWVHIATLIRKMRKVEGYDIDETAVVTRVFNVTDTLKVSLVYSIWIDDNTEGFVYGRAPSSKALGRADGIAWGRTGITTTLITGT